MHQRQCPSKVPTHLRGLPRWLSVHWDMEHLFEAQKPGRKQSSVPLPPNHLQLCHRNRYPCLWTVGHTQTPFYLYCHCCTVLYDLKVYNTVVTIFKGYAPFADIVNIDYIPDVVQYVLVAYSMRNTLYLLYLLITYPYIAPLSASLSLLVTTSLFSIWLCFLLYSLVCCIFFRLHV